MHRRTAQLVVERLLATSMQRVKICPREPPLVRVARSRRDELEREPVPEGLGHSMLPMAKQRLRCEGCLVQVGVKTLGAFLAIACAPGRGKHSTTVVTRDDEVRLAKRPREQVEGEPPRPSEAPRKGAALPHESHVMIPQPQWGNVARLRCGGS